MTFSKIAAVPPGHETGKIPRPRTRINPDAITRKVSGPKLIEKGQFEPIGQVTFAFQLAEKCLDLVASHDDHDHRLHVRRRLRKNFVAPNDVGHGHG